MKTNKHILTLCLVLLTIVTYSQDLAPLDYEQRLSYTEFETEYYLVDQKDLDNISLPDKVKLKELKYEREYDKFINDNAERTTIIKHISTEGVYEDWMEEPEIVFIDKDAVSLYSFKGVEINRIEHTPTYLKLAESNGHDLLRIYNVPNREQMEKMQKAGMQIVELGNNFTQITFKSKQITYNEDLLYMEVSDLNEAGNVMHSIKSTYMQLPDGDLVIERTRESTVVELENNISAEHVFLRLYSNYRYEDVYYKTEESVEAQILKVSSNSDQSKMFISYTPFSESSVSRVDIYNISGRLVRSISVDNSGANELSIQDLDPGVYIINLQSSGKSLSEKFIKL